MRSTPLLLSLPGPLWPGVVAPDRVLSMGQIELFDIEIDCKQTDFLEIELFDHLTVFKQMVWFGFLV